MAALRHTCCVALVLILCRSALAQTAPVLPEVAPYGATITDALGVNAPKAQNAKIVSNDKWAPKGNDYDASQVDWAGVISAFRSIFAYEKRYASWCIRASFHDAGSRDVLAGTGGNDGSLLLTDEALRPENAQLNFATHVANIVRYIVGFYNTSWADGLAVCAAVGREVLSSPGTNSVHDFMPAAAYNDWAAVPFLVGKMDSTTQNPQNQLVSPSSGVASFAAYFKSQFDAKHGIKMGVALLGSHTLLDNQECVVTANPEFPPGTPRMFAWQAYNDYYQDLTSPAIYPEGAPGAAAPARRLLASGGDDSGCPYAKLFGEAATDGDLEAPRRSLAQGKGNKNKPGKAPKPSKGGQPFGNIGGGGKPGKGGRKGKRKLDQNELKQLIAGANCRFTSKFFQKAAEQSLKKQAKQGPVDPDPPSPVAWLDAGSNALHQTCDARQTCVVGWLYTQNDGFLGQACQSPADADALEVQAAVNEFKGNRRAWDAAYANAYNRMVGLGAKYAKGRSIAITGFECPSGWVSDNRKRFSDAQCQAACRSPASCRPVSGATGPCRCATAPKNGKALKKVAQGPKGKSG